MGGGGGGGGMCHGEDSQLKEYNWKCIVRQFDVKILRFLPLYRSEI